MVWNTFGLEEYHFIDNELMILSKDGNSITKYSFEQELNSVTVGDSYPSSMGSSIVGMGSIISMFSGEEQGTVTINFKIKEVEIITDKKEIEMIKAKIFAMDI